MLLAFPKTIWFMALVSLAIVPTTCQQEPTNEDIMEMLKNLKLELQTRKTRLSFNHAEMKLAVGQEAQLDCGIQGVYLSCHWEHSGVIYQLDDVINGSHANMRPVPYVKYNQCSIIIPSVNISHEGLWSCKIFTFGQTLTGSKTITVECLEDRDCGINSVCTSSNCHGEKNCQCIANYSGDANIHCRKTCAALICGKNKICEKGSDNAVDAVCKCLPGYILHTDGSCHECFKHSDCGGNAVCISNNSHEEKKCQCIENYSGDANIHCRKTCAAQICGENEICDEGCDNVVDAVCKCLPGYLLHTDGFCHAVCDPACNNGGTCSAPNNCSCTNSWSGQTCQTPVCDPACKNGGKCTRPDTCVCIPPWTGKTCGCGIGDWRLRSECR